MLSRIFRGENENAAVKRRRQIDTLKIFNDNVLELREDVEYQVQFDAGDKRMAIMVSLSPEFPLKKPVLRISPPINHPWCNEHNEIVNAPGLLNFTVHSDLGRVVQAIIREFSKNPPQFLGDGPPASSKSHRDLQDRASPSYATQQYPDIPSTSYNSYYNYPQYPSSNTNTSTSIYNYNYTSSGTTYVMDSQPKSFASTSHHSAYSPSSTSNSLHSNNTPTPCYSSNQYANTAFLNSHYGNTNYGQSTTTQINVRAKTQQCSEFAELNDLSNVELKKLNDDEDRFDEFLNKHSGIKDLNDAVEDAIDCVEKIAQANLQKESKLRELRNQVAEKVERVTMLKSRYDKLNQRYNKLSEVFTPDHIMNCLKHEADLSHEKSETIAEDFLNRKIDVERFLSTYVECRKLGQARRTKEEKLAHQLNELKRAGY